jgi:hypothetical protein
MALPESVTVRNTVATPTATSAPRVTVTATRTIKVTTTKRTVVYVSRSRVESAQAIARELLATYGWTSQWSCFNSVVMHESGWNVNATNPSSGAYGIPQSLPANKMASAGADWRTNPATQLRWMLAYIKTRYGTPCGAWAHEQKSGWY